MITLTKIFNVFSATFQKVVMFLFYLVLFPFSFMFAENGVTTTTDIPELVRETYSKEVFFQAQPRLRFLQFAKVKTNNNLGIGKSITFVKYNNLEGGGEIEENEEMPSNGMSGSEVAITVKESGNSVTVTQNLITQSAQLFDVLDDASTLLANNMAKTLDTQFRNAVLRTPNIIFGNGKTSAQTLLAGDGLTTSTVKNAVEFLGLNNAPKFFGQYYVCVATPHQLRQLRDDNAWINVNQYSSTSAGRNIFIGEAGMYEGVIFIETTQMPTYTANQLLTRFGAGVSVSQGQEAVLFGENVLGWAISLPVEIRDGGIIDFGRKRKFAWYGIWGVGIIEPKNVVRILTAPSHPIAITQ